MSCTQEDVLDVLDILCHCRLKRAPKSPEDVSRAYWGVLQNQSHGLMQVAAFRWMQNPDGGQWFPSAPDLLSMCLSIEAEQRSAQQAEASKTQGCTACGRVRHPDGPAFSRGGTGWRYVIQRCFPCTIHGVSGCESCAAAGEIDWDAAPYRVGTRKILCDCELGQDILHGHAMSDGGEAPVSVADVWGRFGRTDARLYVTGTEYRMVEDDERPGSPFHCQPSPEELSGQFRNPRQTFAEQLQHAQQTRQLAYGAIRGTIPDHLQGYLMEALNNSRRPGAPKKTKTPSWLKVGKGAA